MPENTSFWNSLISGLQTLTGRGKPAYSTQQKPEGAEQAYASFYPSYEITSPQYVTPNPYTSVQVGYKGNDLVYDCINVRAGDVQQAPIMVLRDTGDGTPEEVVNHPMVQLLRNPCPGVNQKAFLKIVEIYLQAAGFSIWEKERNNNGEVIRLWPMNPAWCSFYRGEGKPLRAVRYQPYGLPPLDVPVEDLVVFGYFDPQWPLLKFYSPTMAAMKVLGLDTNMTDLINMFVTNGAFLGGQLVTDQAITDTEANRAKQIFRETHGGPDKAGEVLVTGKGLKYVETASNFKNMEIGTLDGRSQTRICSIFRVSPIRISSSVGMGTITENNLKEATKSEIENVTVPEWEFIASVLWEQLLPDFEKDNYKSFLCEFDLRKVKALQEDRTAKFTRAIQAAQANVITRDMALEEMGYDPIDNAPVFVGSGGAKTLDDQMKPPEPPPVFASAQIDNTLEPVKEKQEDEKEEVAAEEEAFKSYARRRLKENKPEQIPEFEFKHLPAEKAANLIAYYSAPAVWSMLEKVLNG